MSKKKRRVPPTYQAKNVPAKNWISVASEFTSPGINYVRIAHDDGCPALSGGGMRQCTCAHVDITSKHCETAADYVEAVREGRA